MVLAFHPDLFVTGMSRCFTSGIPTPPSCMLHFSVDDARRCPMRGWPHAQDLSTEVAGQNLSLSFRLRDSCTSFG